MGGVRRGDPRNRKWQIERFREKHGNKRVALLEAAHIVTMMTTTDNKTPAARRNWLKTIKHLLGHAVANPEKGRVGIIGKSPAGSIPLPKIPKKRPDGTERGHHTWTDD